MESISEEKYQELKGEVAPWSPPPPSLCSELSIQFEVMVHRDAQGVVVETRLAVSGKEGEEDETRGSKRQGIESLDKNRHQENGEDLLESHPEDPDAWMRKKGGKRRGKVQNIIPDFDEYEGDGDAMFEEEVTEIEEDEEQEEMIIDENQNIKELGCKKCEEKKPSKRKKNYTGTKRMCMQRQMQFVTCAIKNLATSTTCAGINYLFMIKLRIRYVTAVESIMTGLKMC